MKRTEMGTACVRKLEKIVEGFKNKWIIMLGSAGNVMEAKSGKLYFWGHSKVRRKRKFLYPSHLSSYIYIHKYLIYPYSYKFNPGSSRSWRWQAISSVFPKTYFPPLSSLSNIRWCRYVCTFNGRRRCFLLGSETIRFFHSAYRI